MKNWKDFNPPLRPFNGSWKDVCQCGHSRAYHLSQGIGECIGVNAPCSCGQWKKPAAVPALDGKEPQ